VIVSPPLAMERETPSRSLATKEGALQVNEGHAKALRRVRQQAGNRSVRPTRSIHQRIDRHISRLTSSDCRGAPALLPGLRGLTVGVLGFKPCAPKRQLEQLPESSRVCRHRYTCASPLAVLRLHHISSRISGPFGTVHRGRRSFRCLGPSSPWCMSCFSECGRG
jgi:hypothetical protein